MQHATEKGLRVAVAIDSPALGDTIAAIPTLRKISEAHDNKKITVFTSWWVAWGDPHRRMPDKG
jgi:hypothetical protein